MHEGLTLGIPIISVGDTAEPLLPGGVPDLGRDRHTVRLRQGQGLWWAEETQVVVRQMCGNVGSWDLSFPRFSRVSEHLTMSCLVTVIEFSSLFSAVTSSQAQGLGSPAS